MISEETETSAAADLSAGGVAAQRRKTIQAFQEQVTLFKYLSPVECRVVYTLTSKKHYEDGEVILLEGSPGTGLHIIETGEVIVLKKDAEGQDVAIDIAADMLANDINDLSGDTLSLDSFTDGDNGTVAPAGATLVYTPSPGYAGLDSFNYTVIDGASQTSTGKVFVEVDTKPVLVNAIADQAMTEDQADLQIDLSPVFDSPNHTLSVSAVTDRSLVHAYTQGTDLGQLFNQCIRHTVYKVLLILIF